MSGSMQRIQDTSRWRRLKAVLSLRSIIRKTLVVAVIVSIAIQLPLNNPMRASAWSGDLPGCTVSGGAFSWAWKDRVQTLLGINPDSYNGSIIIGKRSTDSNPATNIQIWFSQNVELNQASPTNRRFIFNGGDGAVDIINNPASGQWQTINSFNAPFSTNVTLNDFTCINSYRAFDGNPVYENDYTGITYGTDVPDQVGVECDTFDVACKIGEVFQGVQNTFSSVGSYIVRGIASIFFPDPDYLEQKFTQLSVFFTQKLGFLMYPIDFIIDMVQAFGNNTENWCTDTSCTKSFGNLWGSPFSIDFLTLKNSLPTYWNWFILFLRGAVVIGLVSSVYRTLMSTIKGTEHK